MDYQTTRLKVLEWANERDLIYPGNPQAQMCKVVEEVGELAAAILKNRRDDIRDAIGDVMVTICILAKQLDVDELQCFEDAYNVIKKRKGKTIDGTFVKD
jgi:NTP pyrophosphatase (non-canonical NTP hydrolase)